MVSIIASQRYIPRKQKERDYQAKYGDIPVDPIERLNYMIDTYDLSSQEMNHILEQRNNMIQNITYSRLKVIQFLEVPIGTGRPRSKIVTKKNFHSEAMKNPQFIQVYSLGASDDQQYMKRLIASELLVIDRLIYTPVTVTYNAFYPTPSYYPPYQKMQAEIGLDIPNASKPDFDNLEKKYSDMFNYNVWIDDATVVSAMVNKYYSILPRVEIHLMYMDMLCNQYQYRNMIKRKSYDGLPIPYLDKKGEIVHV